MRDEKRIPQILRELQTYWEAHPDLRLGQILYNVSYPKDVFYIEDEDFITRLREKF